MAFTAAATTELTKYAKTCEYVLELRTPFYSGTPAWAEYQYTSFSLEWTAYQPATLSASFANSPPNYSSESTQTNRFQLYGEARLTAKVGSETEVKFQGPILQVVPRDFGFDIACADWSVIANDCECEVQLTPDEVEVVAYNAYRQLHLVDGTDNGTLLGKAYGLTVDYTGDPGFDETTQTRRRAWVPGNTTVWYKDDTDPDDPVNEIELDPQLWQIDYESGAVSILENIRKHDDSGYKTYWVKDLHCYVESAASGATNCDFARIYEQALQYAAASGGMGIAVGDCSITDTGVDVAGSFYFLGRVGELFQQLREKQQANIIYYYDSTTQKHTVKLVEQETAPDWTLIHPQSIDQTRETRDVYTRVVASGSSELPLNIIGARTTSASDLVSTTNPTGKWFHWNKANGGTDWVAGASFDDVIKAWWDGDPSIGTGFHDGANLISGTTFYEAVKFDMGAAYRIQHVIAIMPMSANPNKDLLKADDGTYFWPGIKIEVSEDDATYYPVSPYLNGVYSKPTSKIDVGKSDITRPKCRYIKVSLSAFKQGISNSADQAIGLAELQIYVDEEYRVIKQVYATEDAIAAVDQVSNIFVLDGAHTATYIKGVPLTVHESTGNDGTYTVVSSAAAGTGSYTLVTVAEAIPDATVDGWASAGYLYTDGVVFDRAGKDLWVRFGSRYKTKFLPLGNRYNEFLAHDVALLELAESVRLFQKVSYSSVADPRIKPWQTVRISDELNGNIDGVLVEGLTITPKGTTITGTNYKAGALGT